jgi:hypothetical protein
MGRFEKMRVNWHIWSGVLRTATWDVDSYGVRYPHRQAPTVIIDVNLRDWALPLSVHVGGPLLSKPGLTFRIGPVNIGWSKL